MTTYAMRQGRGGTFRVLRDGVLVDGLVSWDEPSGKYVAMIDGVGFDADTIAWAFENAVRLRDPMAICSTIPVPATKEKEDDET